LFSLKSFKVIFFCFFLASHRLKVASKSRLKSQWTKHLQTFLHKNIKNKCPYKLKVLIIDVAIKSGPIFSMVEPKTWPEKVGEIFCYFEVLKKYENSSNSINKIVKKPYKLNTKNKMLKMSLTNRFQFVFELFQIVQRFRSKKIDRNYFRKVLKFSQMVLNMLPDRTNE
jgi:hypothetical protein